MQRGSILLRWDTNQVVGLAEFAKNFMYGTIGKPSDEVYDRVDLFHTDSVLCGLSALACQTNAPTILQNEALVDYRVGIDEAGATVFGAEYQENEFKVRPEKAVLANSSAVRECMYI